MKNILLIEIKDNKTIATLTKLINGKNNLILHKSYISKPLSANGAKYDITIIDSIKKDLKKIIDFKNIDKIFLILNTKETIIKTTDFEIKYNSNFKKSIENYKKYIKNNHPQLYLIKLLHSKSEAVLTKKTIKITTEFVNKEFLTEILKLFKAKGFKIDDLLSISESIIKSMNNNMKLEQSAFNVVVEDGFTLLNTYNNGAILSTVKLDFGLNDIYKHISMMMSNVNITTAREFFNSFGSIPPEDVVDNKIIHTSKMIKGTQIYTKKDLSNMITEKVNVLFANVKKIYSNAPIKIDKMTFSGEIKSLTGFKKYATKSFVEKNIKNISSNQLGLKEETEFFTQGFLLIIKDKLLNDNINLKIIINKKSFNLLNKIPRMYNYI